jgi:hypothetical protein
MSGKRCLMSIFFSFVTRELENYETDDRNRMLFSAAQVERYYEFISIIMERYQRASRAMTSATKPVLESALSDSEELTDVELNVLLEQQRQLAPTLHLEIESFYVFAKILLAKIAHFIQCYFGQGHGCSLRSHHRFRKCHDRYAELKALVYPDGFSGSLSLLQTEICDYGDKLITHQNNPRAMKTTGFSLSDPEVTFLGLGFIDPKENDFSRVPREAKGLVPLLEAIDVYMAQVVELLRMNRDKSCFALTQTEANDIEP